MSTANVPSPPYAELAELAGRLIHEIKNHLGTLTLHLQLLNEDLQNPETTRERRALQRSTKLLEECQRLSNLSNDFLRFARIQELELKPADLKEVVEELLDFYGPSARHAGIEIKAFVPADLPGVQLEPEMFKQALLNLVLNAEQAMPQGGSLTIQAERRQGQVLIRLIDTGAGMKPEVLAQIFKPFYSSRPGGSGLGLPTTRRIIEAHGGTIDAHSEPGKGTMFTIALPVCK